MKLQTAHHPKLVELEREVGRFCFDAYRTPFLNGRLLLLVGDNGNGKTHCANAVHRWIGYVGRGKMLIKKAGEVGYLTSLFWYWPELLDSLKNGQWDVLQDMIETPVLIIDELGGGHDTSRIGVEKLCQVLTRREQVWTLVTTNVAPAAWEETFDKRVESRFYRHSTIVDLTDVPDFNSL